MKGFPLVFSSIVLCVLPAVIEPSRILVLYTFASKSHKNFALPMVHALADKGHDVVFVSPYKDSKQHQRIKEVIVDTSLENLMKKTPQMEIPNFFEMREQQASTPIPFIPFFMTPYFVQIIDIVFKDPQFADVYKPEQKYDLVIICGFMNELNYGIVDAVKAPLVQFVAAEAMSWHSEMMGNPNPSSHIPNLFLNLQQEMSFYQRFINAGMNVVVKLIRDWYYMPRIEAAVKKYFPNVPAFSSIERNTSMILTNGHHVLTHSRPYLPSIVEVGGLHCKPAKPLPKDLADFVDGSGADGFIYFSFGSVVQAHTMPDRIRLAFVEAFGKLRQRVLWKWETETMEGLPKNVKLSKWLPQQDILGHPKIRLFISHGGLLSTQEATYHGVPVVGIPFFGDQDFNIGRAEHDGIAVKVELADITSEKIVEAVNKILNDKRYNDNVKRVSSVFRDNQVHPLDRAVYWIEYVIRHKGARHLRAPSADMSWFEYNQVDVASLYVAIGLAILFANYLALKLFFAFIHRRRDESRKTPKPKKHKKN